VGWFAGKQGWLGVLKYYPFRLGDVLVPLVAWLLAPAAIFEARRRNEAVGTVAAMLVVCCLAYGIWQWLPDGVQRVRDTRKSWPMGTPATTDLGNWVQDNTPRESVFVAPPCLFDFWIRARRPLVVSYKAMPHGPRAQQWYQRLLDVAGADVVPGVGFEACKPLQSGHAKLTREALLGLRAKYGAQYYVVRGRRPDLATAEIYRDVRFAVYDVRTIASR
jgi:hypothetical protein